MGFKFKELFKKHEDRDEQDIIAKKKPVTDFGNLNSNNFKPSGLRNIQVNNVANPASVNERNPDLDAAVDAVVITEDTSPSERATPKEIENQQIQMQAPPVQNTQEQNSGNFSMPSLAELHSKDNNTEENAVTKELDNIQPKNDTEVLNSKDTNNNVLNQADTVKQNDDFSGGYTPAWAQTAKLEENVNNYQEVPETAKDNLNNGIEHLSKFRKEAEIVSDQNNNNSNNIISLDTRIEAAEVAKVSKEKAADIIAGTLNAIHDGEKTTNTNFSNENSDLKTLEQNQQPKTVEIKKTDTVAPESTRKTTTDYVQGGQIEDIEDKEISINTPEPEEKESAELTEVPTNKIETPNLAVASEPIKPAEVKPNELKIAQEPNKVEALNKKVKVAEITEVSGKSEGLEDYAKEIINTADKSIDTGEVIDLLKLIIKYDSELDKVLQNARTKNGEPIKNILGVLIESESKKETLKNMLKNIEIANTNTEPDQSFKENVTA